MNQRKKNRSLCLRAGSVPCMFSSASKGLQRWNPPKDLSPQRHRDPQRRREILFAIATVLTLGLVPSVHAQVARPIEDPAIEQRMKHLTKELRCLVCQNETLADSQAPLAEDLRREIREQIKAGKSDEEILAYATQRYGDFVLYNPPVKATTYLLWFGPFVALLGGTAFLYRYLKRRRELIEVKPLTVEERRRAEKLLKEM
jgi:cytochrome c-type biogenesis protein CcmH